MDDFRVVSGAGGKPLTPIKIGPSVSPIFGNGPSFTVFTYDRASGAATDYAVHTIVPAAAGPMASSWKTEYVFTSAYKLPGYGARGLASLAGRIRSDSATRLMFGSFYNGQSGANPMQGTNWLAYACAETALVPSDYSACTCPPIAN
jgi:sphingomyelin phosphodiesterase acid-like 3